MRLLTVGANEEGQRLDKLLSKYLSEAGKGFLYKMLRKKNITLNGKKCDGSERLKKGDEIRLFLSEETIEKFSGKIPGQVSRQNSRQKAEGKAVSGTYPDGSELSIIYEDSHILLASKPAGMLSQKARESDISMVEQIIGHLLAKGELTAEELRTFRPSVCNRLDRNTSGLIAAGKSLAGLQMLSEAFRERTVHKYYLCIAAGRITKPFQAEGFLKKDEKTNQVTVSKIQTPDSDPILTRYVPLGVNDNYTLLEAELITGKTHQIRAHLAFLGHPIAGDMKYGSRRVNEKVKREYGVSCQLLHSWRLIMPENLQEPFSYLSGKEFRARVPSVFQNMAEKEGLTGFKL